MNESGKSGREGRMIIMKPMSALTEEIEKRGRGESVNHMLAYVWDDELSGCYLRVYEDITIIDRYDPVTGL